MPDDSDEAVRALFHRIDDGPPLDIDMREVMANGRRIRTRRTRLAVASSAFAVVAAAALVGLSMGGDVQTPDLRPATSPPSPPTTPPATSPVPPVTGTPPPVTGPADGGGSPPTGGPGGTGPAPNTGGDVPRPGTTATSNGGGAAG